MKTHEVNSATSFFTIAIAALAHLSGIAAAAEASLEYNPKPLPGDLILPMPEGGEMVFRAVSIGKGKSQFAVREFRMGDRQADSYQEYPTEVVVGGSFPIGEDWVYYIGKYEVSVAQFCSIIDGDERIEEGGAMPITGTSWFEAIEFINSYNTWLFKNAASHLPKNGDRLGFVRLPTEIEWEFAARGGNQVSADQFDSQHPYGDDLRLHEWYSGAESSHNKKKAIGLLQPSPLGVHDMLGNVSEMTSSPYMVEYYQGRVGGFVSRGADFFTPKAQVRSSYRAEQPYYSRDPSPEPASVPTLGFRLVLSAPLHVGGSGKDEMEDAWVVYRESRNVPSIPTPVIATQHGKTTDRVKEVMAELETLKKSTEGGGTVTPEMISRINLLSSALGDIQSLANSAEKKSAEGWTNIAVNAGYTVAREMYKLRIGERLLKLTGESGNEAEHRRALAQHEARKQNIEDAWIQYRSSLEQLGASNAKYADDALAGVRDRAEDLSIGAQVESIDVIKSHLKRYREEQRITFEGYASDFENLFTEPRGR